MVVDDSAHNRRAIADMLAGAGDVTVVGKATDGKAETRRVTDVSAGEVLLLTPDGKLQLLETALDVKDDERQKRLNLRVSVLGGLVELRLDAGQRRPQGFADLWPLLGDVASQETRTARPILPPASEC